MLKEEEKQQTESSLTTNANTRSHIPRLKVLASAMVAK